MTSMGAEQPPELVTYSKTAPATPRILRPSLAEFTDSIHLGKSTIGPQPQARDKKFSTPLAMHVTVQAPPLDLLLLVLPRVTSEPLAKPHF
jgi:hypothetical protein